MGLILAGALMVLTAGWTLGCCAFRMRPPSRVLALAAGLPLLSLALFALLVAGAASKWMLLALCLAPHLILLRRRPEFAERVALPPWWVAIPAGVFTVFYTVHALTPEIQPDAMGYHLGLVAEWIRTHGFAGRIGFYEMLPLGFETLFLPAASVGGYPAAKLLHLALLAATAALAARCAVSLGLKPEAGWAGGLLYALAPVAGVSGTSAYNDAALVFFITATLALLLERRPEYAGLTAGFCYAVKMTGAVAVLAGLALLVFQRRRRDALRFGALASLSFVPWMARSFLLTGNPLAPLGNQLFPNPFFHATTEALLSGQLRSYGGVAWTDVPLALALSGASLQGLIGPVFLLAPLVLLGLRNRAGRWLAGISLVLALPWAANIGARFLMPALPFLATGMLSVLPRRLMVAVLWTHAVLSLPPVLDLYADQAAWRLKGFPWRAALRLEGDADYLKANSWEYDLARMVSRHVKPGDTLLDLVGAPSAYLPSVPVGPLPSVPFDQMAQTLRVAASALPDTLETLECRFPPRFLRAIRLRIPMAKPARWALNEVTFLYDGHPIRPSRRWMLDAWPWPEDSPLGCDVNPATAWQDAPQVRAGSYYEVTFDRPVPLDRIDVVSPYMVEGDLVPEIFALSMDRRWEPLGARQDIVNRSSRPLRGEATELLRRNGIGWILASRVPEGHGVIGASMAMVPNAWRVELVEQIGDYCLFRLTE